MGRIAYSLKSAMRHEIGVELREHGLVHVVAVNQKFRADRVEKRRRGDRRDGTLSPRRVVRRT